MSDVHPRWITWQEVKDLSPKYVQMEPIARPANPTEGLLYADSTDHKLYYYNGTAWQELTFSPGPA